MTLPVQISIFILLVLSVGMHEAAHARVATYFGDPTPEEDGVNTWNPIPHIMRSFLMCLVIPAFFWFLMGYFIGGAYVMLNPALMRPRRLGYFCAVAAGPGMNLLLATIFMIIAVIAGTMEAKPLTFTLTIYPFLLDAPPVVLIFALAGAYNVLLFVFNLIPIPPLDGSSMLATAIPALKPLYQSIQSVGLIILIILLNTRLGGYLWWPVAWYAEAVSVLVNRFVS